MSDDDSMAVMIVLAIILEKGQTMTAYVFHVLFLYRLLVFNNEWSFSVLSLDIDILSSGNKKYILSVGWHSIIHVPLGYWKPWQLSSLFNYCWGLLFNCVHHALHQNNENRVLLKSTLEGVRIISYPALLVNSLNENWAAAFVSEL